MPTTPETQCNGQYIDYVYKQASLYLDFSYGINTLPENPESDILYGHRIDYNNNDFYVVGIDAKTLELLFSKKIHIPPHADPDYQSQYGTFVDEFPQHIYPSGNNAFLLYYESPYYKCHTRREVLFTTNENRDSINLIFDLEFHSGEVGYADPSYGNDVPYPVIYSPEYGVFITTKHYNSSWAGDIFKFENGTISHIISFNTNDVITRLKISGKYLISWWWDLLIYDLETHTYLAKDIQFQEDGEGGEPYWDYVRTPNPFIHNGIVYAPIQENDVLSNIFAFNPTTNELKRTKLLTYCENEITNIYTDLPSAGSVIDDEILLAQSTELTLRDNDGNSSQQKAIIYFYKNNETEVLKATNFGNIEQPFWANVKDKRITLLEDNSYNSNYYAFYPIKYTGNLNLCYCAAPIEYEWENLTTQITDIGQAGEPPMDVSPISEITIEDFDFSWDTLDKFTWCGSHPLFTPFARTFTPYGADIKLTRGGIA